MIWDEVVGGLFRVLDRVIPDPTERAAAKQRLLELEQQGQLAELQARYSAITTEAASADPWTSRARPSFMYVFYFLLIALVVLAPLVGVFFPDQMGQFFANVQAGFAAIPEAMWWTFSAGYLGYTTARSVEKGRGFTS